MRKSIVYFSYQFCTEMQLVWDINDKNIDS